MKRLNSEQLRNRVFKVNSACIIYECIIKSFLLFCLTVNLLSCVHCDIGRNDHGWVNVKRKKIIVNCAKCKSSKEFNDKIKLYNQLCPYIVNKGNEGIYQVIPKGTHMTFNGFVFLKADCFEFISREEKKENLINMLKEIGISEYKARIKIERLIEFRKSYKEEYYSF